MNGAVYMLERHGSKLALVTAPGEYGEDCIWRALATVRARQPQANTEKTAWLG